jgi:TATA-binding protein-associated factor Taf7
MADKVPVQDKLSQILAELMWCLAGTEEDDEYAGQLYLQMDESSEDFDPDDSDEDEYKILSVERVEGEEESADGESEAEETEEDEKHCRGAHLVSLYIATFLRTVRREWGNVDKHRVDKFYTAVRLMLSEVRSKCDNSGFIWGFLTCTFAWLN